MPRLFIAVLAAAITLTIAPLRAEESGFSNLLQNIIGSNADEAKTPAINNDGIVAANPDVDAAAPPASFEPMPFAVLRTLDKVTARAKTVQVKLDQPFKVGNLLVVVKACRQRPPEEPPESAAFLQIAEEKTSNKQVKNLFSGWMFASSPGLSALEHPIYDIWLVKCAAPAAPKPVDDKTAEKAEAKPDKTDVKKDAKKVDSKPGNKLTEKSAGKSIKAPAKP